MKPSDPVEGHWWLPESPGRERFGRLEFDTGNSWSLEVMGSLREPPELLPGDPIGEDDGPTEVPVIHGRAANGTVISLFACWAYPSLWPMEPTRDVWRFQSMVEGADAVTPDRLLGELKLRLGSLLEWAGPRRPSVRRDGREVTITSDTVEAGTANIEGGTVTLELDCAVSVRNAQAQMNNGAMFRYLPEQSTTFSNAMKDCVLPLRDLLCFLTLGYVEVEEVIAWEGATGDQTERQHGLSFRTQLQCPTHPARAPWRQDMLATRAAVGLTLQELVGEWFVLRGAQEKAIKLLLLPHNAPYLYSDDKLMTASLAMESYHDIAIGGTAVPPEQHSRRVDAIVESAPTEHRPWAENLLRSKNTKGQTRKLREVVDRAGSTGERLLDAVPRFVNLVVSCRNRIAHPASVDDRSGVRYVAGGMGLRWLLRHCLLSDLGLGERAGDLIGECNSFENDLYLMRRWADALA